MSTLTRDLFPSVLPETYGGLNSLRTELLLAFNHAAEHPVSGQVLLQWIFDSLAVGVEYTGLIAPA